MTRRMHVFGRVSLAWLLLGALVHLLVFVPGSAPNPLDVWADFLFLMGIPGSFAYGMIALLEWLSAESQ